MAKRGVNKVIIVGNLGGDPEVRSFPSGDAVTNVTVATSEAWKDKTSGEQKEKTEWHRVSIRGKLAEIAGEYLKKGSKVYLEGKLQTRKWTNDQGADQYTTEVIIDGFEGVMQMLDSKPQNGQAQGQQQGQPQGGYQQQAPQQNQGYQSQQNPTYQQSVNQGQQQSGSQQLAAKRQQAASERQQQAPQNQQQPSGYQQGQQGQQQGGFANQGQQNQQQAPKVNPQEPTIDFDDGIPF